MKKTLIEKATNVCNVINLNTYPRNCSGKVGCALLSKKGNIYTGISVDLVCGLGACAEYSAIAEMLKNGETEIDTIVAVYNKEKIIPPCGRCRELITQIDAGNMETNVIVAPDTEVKLKDLLPGSWNLSVTEEDGKA